MLKVMLTLFTAFVFFAQPVSAQDYIAGTHYEVLATPVKTRDAKKIEVVELFWYGCSHCFKFEPMVEAWKKQQANDVDFHRIPAIWHKTMSLHAQAFYTAQALKILDKIHHPLFTLMNVKKKKMKDEASIAEFFATQGVDKKTFEKTFNSFGVKSQLSLAKSRALSYHLQGTPEIVVNGKYRISSNMTGSQANMIKVADFLVSKERAALAK